MSGEDSRESPPGMGQGVELARRSELSIADAESVLRRAAELDVREGAGGSVSLAEVQRLGQELGISEVAVRAALQEVTHRELVPQAETRGLLDGLLGPRSTRVHRVVRGSAGDVQRRVHEYLRGQLFDVKRDLGHRTIWKPSSRFADGLKRLTDMSSRYELTTLCEIDVAVLPGTGDGVDVIAAIRHSPARRLAKILVGTTAMLAGGGAALLSSAVPWVAAFPFVAALAALGLERWSVAHQRKSTEEPLERLLDQIARA